MIEKDDPGFVSKVNAVSGKVQNIQRNSIKGKCRVFVSLPDRFQNKLYKDTMKERTLPGKQSGIAE